MNTTGVTDNETESVLNAADTWPFAFMLAFGLFGVLMMQSVWETISGLYFTYAYEAVFWPLIMYLILGMYHRVNGGKVNRTKDGLVFFTLLCLFSPALFLYATNQLDAHSVIHTSYNPELNHLPYAQYLPYLFLVAIFAPYKDFLQGK